MLAPHPELMAAAPIGLQAHGMVAMLLFALWPFTAPGARVQQTGRLPVAPFVVYRSKDVPLGARKERRGWERV